MKQLNQYGKLNTPVPNKETFFLRLLNEADWINFRKDWQLLGCFKDE